MRGYLKKRIYVDCSQIFKCDRELLESLVDLDNDLYKQTKKMRDIEIEDIKNLLFDAVMDVPPNLSIVEVKIDENGNTYGESLYLCQQKIDEKFNFANFLGVDFKEEYEQKLLDLKSTKSDIRARVKNRYNNGVEFCKMFLNEYFPNELGRFYLSQGLAKVDEELLNKDNNNSKNKKTEKDFSM